MVICWGLGKVFVCAFTINSTYYGSFRFTVLLKHLKRLSNVSDFKYLFTEVKLPGISIIQNNIVTAMYYALSLSRMNVWEKFRPHRRETYLLSKEKYNKMRADWQRAERHSSANLFKVCLVDVLLLWWGTYVHSSCATVNRQWLCAS